MRQALSVVLALVMTMQLAPTAHGAQSVAEQVTALPPGTRVELHLKNKQTMRGTTGAVSDSGFAFVVPGAEARQMPFAEVASVKRLDKKSHTTRNVLIGVGVGVAVTAVALVIYVKKCGPFGCNAK